MKVLHVISGLQKASGVTTFVEALVCELKKRGVEADVLTKGNPVRIEGCSLVHIHGLWDPFLHVAAKVARTAGVPVVWSPHGMLQKWALKNKWWKKLPALMLYQWRDLRSAALLHATARSEVDDIRRLKLKNKIVVAPLGVRFTDEDIGLGRRSGSTEDAKTLLFVSRVQRKKGLPNLIEAWSRLPQDLRKGWQIRVVGPDQDNHIAELKAQCDRLGLTYKDETIHCTTTTPDYDFAFTGPKYDSELDAEYSNADLFVLPTHSENFGSVVIEALAHGVPVITTKEAPWAELEEFKCGWWIDDNVDALAAALKEALSRHCTTTASDYDSLSQMGERGRALVAERYTWPAVCDKMIEGYMEVLNGRA